MSADLKVEDREELKRLRTIVAGLDRAVKKLAEKYLKGDFDDRIIGLESFFDLIVERAMKDGRRQATEAFLRQEIHAKMEKIAKGYAEGHIRDTVFLPILVRPIGRRESGLNAPKRYRAFSIRGNVTKASPAGTPEKAYEALRGLLQDHFAVTIYDVGTIKRDLMEVWDEAAYLMDDVVAGFRVIVKVHGGVVEDGP